MVNVAAAAESRSLIIHPIRADWTAGISSGYYIIRGIIDSLEPVGELAESLQELFAVIDDIKIPKRL